VVGCLRGIQTGSHATIATSAKQVAAIVATILSFLASENLDSSFFSINIRMIEFDNEL